MTKERLREYRAMRLEKEQLENQIRQVEATLYRPKIQRLKHAPREKGADNATERLITKHLELLGLYQEKLAELAGELLEIEKAIEGLPHTERTLLRHRYIEGLSWERVCVAMNYSWRQLHYIHARALEVLKKGSGE